jgi:YegS/Rv2252/BmrU family lipid kinase
VAREICVIVNPSAGRGRAAARLPELEAALRARGVKFRVERTTSLEHAMELATATLETGEIAAAMGGDGIAGAVAHALRHTEGVLGVVPGGRGNDFARKLGIPEDPEGAAEVLATAQPRTIDVADADGRTFLGIVSAGIDSDVQDLVLKTKLKLGSLIYVYGLLQALRKWKSVGFTVTIDGETRAYRGYSIAVSNSGVFGGGMYLVPDAELDDGLVEVVTSGELPRRHYLLNIPKVFKGTHVHEPQIDIVPAREVTFSADRPFIAYADGDPISDCPVTVRVLPGALKVLAP